MDDEGYKGDESLDQSMPPISREDFGQLFFSLINYQIISSAEEKLVFLGKVSYFLKKCNECNNYLEDIYQNMLDEELIITNINNLLETESYSHEQLMFLLLCYGFAIRFNIITENSIEFLIDLMNKLPGDRIIFNILFKFIKRFSKQFSFNLNLLNDENLTPDTMLNINTISKFYLLKTFYYQLIRHKSNKEDVNIVLLLTLISNISQDTDNLTSYQYFKFIFIQYMLASSNIIVISFQESNTKIFNSIDSILNETNYVELTSHDILTYFFENEYNQHENTAIYFPDIICSIVQWIEKGDYTVCEHIYHIACNINKEKVLILILLINFIGFNFNAKKQALHILLLAKTQIDMLIEDHDEEICFILKQIYDSDEAYFEEKFSDIINIEAFRNIINKMI